MDFNGLIKEGFGWIAVPLLGLVALAAIAAGKMKALGYVVLALVVGAAFVFMPMGTIQQIGTAAAQGVAAFLQRG